MVFLSTFSISSTLVHHLLPINRNPLALYRLPRFSFLIPFLLSKLLSTLLLLLCFYSSPQSGLTLTQHLELQSYLDVEEFLAFYLGWFDVVHHHILSLAC